MLGAGLHTGRRVGASILGTRRRLPIGTAPALSTAYSAAELRLRLPADRPPRPLKVHRVPAPGSYVTVAPTLANTRGHESFLAPARRCTSVTVSRAPAGSLLDRQERYIGTFTRRRDEHSRGRRGWHGERCGRDGAGHRGDAALSPRRRSALPHAAQRTADAADPDVRAVGRIPAVACLPDAGPAIFPSCPPSTLPTSPSRARAAPDARFVPAPADGVLPEGFFSTTNLPTYVRIGGAWRMPREPRMDSALVLDADGVLWVREGRRVERATASPSGEAEDGSEGIYVHAARVHGRGRERRRVQVHGRARSRARSRSTTR